MINMISRNNHHFPRAKIAKHCKKLQNIIIFHKLCTDWNGPFYFRVQICSPGKQNKRLSTKISKSEKFLAGGGIVWWREWEDGSYFDKWREGKHILIKRAGGGGHSLMRRGRSKVLSRVWAMKVHTFIKGGGGIS